MREILGTEKDISRGSLSWKVLREVRSDLGSRWQGGSRKSLTLTGEDQENGQGQGPRIGTRGFQLSLDLLNKEPMSFNEMT